MDTIKGTVNSGIPQRNFRMLRERNCADAPSRSLKCCFACTYSVRKRRTRKKKKKPTTTSVHAVKQTLQDDSDIEVLEIKRVVRGRTKISRNDDAIRQPPQEYALKYTTPYCYGPPKENHHVQNEKWQLFKLLKLDLLFSQKRYVRKSSFRTIEQCAAWINSERYHWGGWHLQVSTSQFRFGILMVIARCWWSQTLLKCAHKMAIVVMRNSFAIVYEKNHHNHAIFRRPLVNFEDFGDKNCAPSELLRKPLPPVETFFHNQFSPISI